MTDPESSPSVRRPLRPRNVLAVVVLLAVVGIVLVAIPVVRISTAVPGSNPDGPAQLAGLAERYQRPSVQPDQPNGYVILQDALIRADQINSQHCQLLESAVEETFGHSGSECVTLESLTDPEEPPAPFVSRHAANREERQAEYNGLHQDHARRYLSDLEDSGTFEALDEVAATRRAVPEYDFNGPMIFVRDFRSLTWARQLVRVLEFRFRERLASSTPADAARPLEHMLAISRTLSHDPGLIVFLVAIAAEQAANTAVLEALDARRLDADTLEALLAAYDRQLPKAPWESAIESQRLETIDLIEWTHSDDGAGSGYALPASSGAFTGAARPSVRNVRGLFLARKDEAIRAVDAAFDEWLEIASVPVALRDRAPLGPDSPLHNPRLGALAMLAPAATSAQRANDQSDCITGGVRIRLAIELHRARTGALPATLDALAPDVLSQVPPDAFAPDARYRYVVLDSPDQHARDYLLYSVGADAADNAATRTDTEKPTDAFHPDHPGTDYLFTPAPKPASNPAP